MTNEPNSRADATRAELVAMVQELSGKLARAEGELAIARHELELAAVWLEDLYVVSTNDGAVYEMHDPSAPTALQLANQLRARIARQSP